jgi:hypothetical protein
MAALFALLAAPLIATPLLAGAFGFGTAPSGPPPVATLPPVIHLSLVGGGVQAGRHLQVQALVTTVTGLHEQGTVSFRLAGSSMTVGSPLDASSTAVANLGIATTGPTVVDASFVPSGGSAVAATAEATFRASPIPITPFISVGPATAGRPVAVQFGVNLGPSGYAPGGHVDVMLGVASVRSAFCVLAPGGGTSVAGVWNCTATIPSLPAGNVQLHVVLADSPYYDASRYLIVPVAATPAATAPPKGAPHASSPGTPSTSAAVPGASPTPSASSASPVPTAVAGSATRGSTVAGASPNSSTSAAVANEWWIVLFVIALAAIMGAGLLIVRVVRRARTTPASTRQT